MSAIHIADTGLFVAMGQPSKRRYQVVRTFTRRNGMTFVLPERVYDELTVNASDVETPPVDIAIDEGWSRVAEPLEYSHGLVSRTMDGVQRYIANADDRPADEIERADPALAGVAAQAFVNETADHAYIYTTDTLAGEGAETVLASEGYGDSVTYVNGFRFVEDLL
ncbi:hypothetical protein AUR64_02165 [Haloprofundus marisrubri]|uniref:PIN domain-containing protein n=1 Tax=Haloprofundus marisrubri TaxID=1514971 RepID=A0A0W1R2X3_9EURY|nr:hypothetical protein [Haloprofundus marisrubri]KTG07669.1 hypothetical protein AUR64_02165 [Haloprofundus marisrubri]